MDIKEQARKRAEYHSERQRNREAVRDVIKRFQGDNVHKIDAFSVGSEEGRRTRTCGYCRVSTLDEEQGMSIQLQIDEYPRKIKVNPDLEFTGLYVDDGSSGTNVTGRNGFQLMMQDAYEGRFEQIFTKSVSRFARNIIDCLAYTEELKKLGINVFFFEAEGLNSMGSTSSIILVVLAMAAQEESHSKSNAILLSLEWRLSKGKFQLVKLLGYDSVKEDNVRKLVVNPVEAKIVKYMYLALLSGLKPAEIAENLSSTGCLTGGIKRDGTLNDTFTANGVVATMRNERYCGDVIGRKTFTPDYITHKSKINRGERNRYYQPDHHPAIVPRNVWNAAQRILNSRRYHYHGKCLALKVINYGILRGYILINPKWNGYEHEDMYRASSIAMGREEGGLDVENSQIPDRGLRLPDGESRNGVVKIKRTAQERELESEKQDGEELTGFQIISDQHYGLYAEPHLTMRKYSIVFSKSCRERIQGNRAELLYNPVEQVVALRPGCSDYSFELKKEMGATALCSAFRYAMGWDDQSTCIIKAETYGPLLKFDLASAKVSVRKKETKTEEKSQKTGNVISRGGRVIFYEPSETENPEELEAMLRRRQEEEARRMCIFGKQAELWKEKETPDIETWNAEPVEIGGAVEPQTPEQLLKEIRKDWKRNDCDVDVL